MNPDLLASDIKDSLGFSGEKTSDQTTGMAKSIVEEIQQSGLVSFVAGTITGTCPPGGPITLGKGDNGKILGILGPSLASRFQLNMGFPSITSQLQTMADGIINHIISMGSVAFNAGGIVGACTNTATSPGPFVGAGSKGKISNLDPDILAKLLAAGLGGPPTDQVKAMAKAIVDHISNEGEAFFLSGIIGVAPSGGGPLVAGAGVGGKVL